MTGIASGSANAVALLRPRLLPISLRALLMRGVVRLALFFVQRLTLGRVDVLRRHFNLIGSLGVVPRAVRIERTTLGGVPADLLIPPNARDGAALLYLHGGGFVIGNPRTHRAMVARLALYSGLRVWLPDYRLAPEHAYPAAIDDASAAWQALQAQGLRCVLAGESAGGGLCASLCQRLRRAGLPMPERLYLQSPWLDLGSGNPSRRQRNALDPMIKSDWLQAQFALPYAAGHDLADPDLSPQQGDAAGFPPTLLQVGSHEVLHDDAVIWANKLRAEGVTTELHIGEGLWHAWPFFAPLVPEATAALRQAGAWLRLPD